MTMMMNTWRCMRRGISTSAVARDTTWYQNIIPVINDPIKCVTQIFLADSHPQKMNLAEGAFKDREGNPLVLQCVRDAKSRIAANSFLKPISKEASSKFIEECKKLVCGEDSNIIEEGRTASIQALGGTGACNLFAMFQRQLYPDSIIYLPHPTWSIHHDIWRNAHVPKRTYRYYNPDSRGLNFAAFMDDVKNAPDDSFFLLHPCAHNPTGVDPSYAEWREISSIFKEKNHFPFFDMAYQGLASGDVDKDARAIRIFLEDGHVIGCAQSFTKNMGLYGHQVGCLSVLCNNKLQASAIEDQIHQIANTMHAEQPIPGMLLASQVLSNPDIKATWIEELKAMVTRIRTMRVTLREALERAGSVLNWQHITDQVGMFCYSGLTPNQVDQLAKDFHIYVAYDGRISMAGVTAENVDYLATAIHKVTESDLIHDPKARILLKYPCMGVNKFFP